MNAFESFIRAWTLMRGSLAAVCGQANGRYASLLLLSDGTPVIAYRASTVGAMGQVNSIVRVARRVSFRARAAGQSSFQGRAFLRIGMMAVACRSTIAVWQRRLS